MKQHNGYDYTLLNTLRYKSLFSSKEFKIDSNNNLKISELSPFSNRNESIPLDFISLQPVVKRKLDIHLTVLAIISSLASALFFITAIFANQLWAVSFAVVLYVISVGLIIVSYKKSSTTYRYNFVNTNTLLFTLYESFTAKNEVKKFIEVLNEKITSLNKVVNKKDEKITVNHDRSEEIYNDSKRAQYIKPLDFLYNHGIVDDILYEELTVQIDIKTNDSQDIIRLIKNDNSGTKVPVDNIIYFPVNA